MAEKRMERVCRAREKCGSVETTALCGHQVTFTWVKGHNGHPENERCDQLATEAADGDALLEDTGCPV